MTRLDLLKILVGQARTNGFDFRHWFVTSLRRPWESPSAALAVIESQRRYYALLFNHDFAQSFWKAGQPITFQIPAQTFLRTMADGSVRVVKRKSFMRRSGRPDAWRYHLREMAIAEDPLRYMRKYLRVEDDLIDDLAIPVKATGKRNAVPRSSSPTQPPRLGLTTLALARQAAERRKQAEAALPPLPPPPTPSASRRGARLPGSR
jgi:hypothetical protein